MHAHPINSVLIIGTGALASLVGARLRRAGGDGLDVTLAGSWPEALAAIERDGVTVDERHGSWRAPVRAADIAGPLPMADLVLVLVKSHQTERVAPHAARAVAPDGLVLTLQNGLGNREALERHVGMGRVAQGVTSMGATLVAPGHVRAGGDGHTVIDSSCSAGSADGDGRSAPGSASSPRAAEAARLLTAAGFPTTTSGDLDALVWRKLVASSAINALSALRGVPNGELLRDPSARAKLEEAAREVGRVAAARGIDLGADPVALALQVATDTAGNTSSMLQDVRRGAPTEIDAINGAVVREGRRLGVPTPVNEELVEAVRRLESSTVRRTGPALTAEAAS